MPQMGESKLPSLFMVSGYKVFFWSNENEEPIHVHIAKGKPSPNATKIWLTRAGGCIVASNGSKISQNIWSLISVKRKKLPVMRCLCNGDFVLIEKHVCSIEHRLVQY